MLFRKYKEFFCLIQSQKFGLSALQRSGFTSRRKFLSALDRCPLQSIRFIEVFYEDLTRQRPFQKTLSALPRCPLQSMSALGRFYYINKDPSQKMLYIRKFRTDSYIELNFNHRSQQMVQQFLFRNLELKTTVCIKQQAPGLNFTSMQPRM